jgi:streptogramin lyase
MRAFLPLLALASLALAGCSSRERANPFDPRNPETSGRPSGFVAVAGDREVRLRWLNAQGTLPSGYQLFRRGPGEVDYRPITDILGIGVTSFRDLLLWNGRDYAYRLYFVFPTGIGSRPAEDVAAPGAAVPWVIESGGADLVQVTPDGRRIAARLGGYGATTGLAASAADGAVWIADGGFGRVIVYLPTSGVTVSIPGFNRPGAVAVDTYDGSGWICDVGQNLVFHFRPNGEVASLPIAPLAQPVDVAVDLDDGSVWICELAGNRVGRYDSTHPLWQRTLPAPSGVALDSTTRDGWITSYAQGTVTHLSPDGEILATLASFASPLGVAVDARRGRIWIADPGSGSVVALRRDGSQEFRVAGLADVGQIDVDLGTGEAWAVLGDSGEIARISPAGVVLRRLRGLRGPVAVSVDPGGR